MTGGGWDAIETNFNVHLCFSLSVVIRATEKGMNSVDLGNSEGQQYPAAAR